LLNDITRDRGGDVVEENISRYQVTLHRPGAKDAVEWTGEVTGSPSFIPLQTVDAVTGGKTVIVLDKGMKKLWEAQLNFDVPAGTGRGPDGEPTPGGEGPCAERGDALYVYDGGVLTAFDLASGTVRWRLPSVGTTGLFFDDQGMIYVNTTSATPDNLKYSNQIDVTEKIHPVVLKVEPKTGKTLWRANNDGAVSYVSGKLVYSVESYHGDDDEADGLLGVETIFHVPAHVRIKRLDAGNGRVLWQHYQKRFPLDVRYDKNSIHLLFKKEVQVLKFILL
jgi:outer membrane protein assembly factor BamB